MKRCEAGVGRDGGAAGTARLGEFSEKAGPEGGSHKYMWARSLADGGERAMALGLECAMCSVTSRDPSAAQVE